MRPDARLALSHAQTCTNRPTTDLQELSTQPKPNSHFHSNPIPTCGSYHRVLNAVPGSILVLKGNYFADAQACSVPLFPSTDKTTKKRFRVESVVFKA